MAKQDKCPVVLTVIGKRMDSSIISTLKLAINPDGTSTVLEYKDDRSPEKRRTDSKMAEMLINQKLNEVYPGGEGFVTGST